MNSSPESAFRESSEERDFLGQILKPYSFLRREAAKAMGLKIGRLKPEEITITPGENGEPDLVTYDLLLTDAAIIIWLRLQTDRRCREARRDPQKAAEEADEWADENRIADGMANHALAMELFAETVNAVDESTGIPDAEKGGGGTLSPNV